MLHPQAFPTSERESEVIRPKPLSADTSITVSPDFGMATEFGIIRANCRRDGGVVDRTGLENRRAARSRGFESLSLRQIFLSEIVC